MRALLTIVRCARNIAAAAFAAFAAAGAANAAGADALAARYAAWQANVAQDAAAPRLAIFSSEEAGRMRGDIDGVIDARFDALAARLASPRHWCDIALLHLNVKACTHQRDENGDTVTFYSGSKRFERTTNAYALRYAFRVDTMRPDYIAVDLSATAGPFDTRDYSIVVEAMPAGSGSFVHLRYAYRPSAASRMATKAYLATAGAMKKGFSVIGRDAAGQPEYVRGMRGIVERNAARNFFAIEAFLANAGEAPSEIARRFEQWFDLCERYAEQLHELDRSEYLAIKQQELRQQLAEQQAIDAKVLAR
jgi:hypothetical protein